MFGNNKKATPDRIRRTTTTTTHVLMESFLSYANDEYEKLSDYCNSLSCLSSSSQQQQQQSQSQHHNITDDTITNNFCNVTDLTRQQYLSQAMKVHSLTEEETAVIKHYDALNELRVAHSKLVQWKEDICDEESIIIVNDIHSQEEQDDNEFSSSGCCFQDTESFKLALEHLELSGRTLRTCASSSMSKGYGPFFEDGIVKNLIGTGDWHEIRIVSLVGLRGSIANMERICKRQQRYNKNNDA